MPKRYSFSDQFIIHFFLIDNKDHIENELHKGKSVSEIFMGNLIG